MTRVALGLGSNHGAREEMLRRCRGTLEAWLGSLMVSSVYETPALLPPGAPLEWDMPFLNCAVLAETSLSPRAILEHSKQLEISLGRRARGHWGPREIDIDILAYGSEEVDERDLRIPHAGLTERPFALVPLAELWPEWMHPCLKKRADALAADMRAGVTPYPMEWV